MAGLVHVFTGDGKGKTSAALGIAVRAAGHGLRTHITFFMKGDYPYGEQKTLALLPNISVARFGSLEFVDPANVKPEEKEQARLALEDARQAVLSGKYDLVILDEVNVAAAWKLIDVEDVIRTDQGEAREGRPDTHRAVRQRGDRGTCRSGDGDEGDQASLQEGCSVQKRDRLLINCRTGALCDILQAATLRE